MTRRVDRIRKDTNKRLKVVREVKALFSQEYLGKRVFSIGIGLDPGTGNLCLVASGTSRMLEGLPEKYRGIVVRYRISDQPITALGHE